MRLLKFSVVAIGLVGLITGCAGAPNAQQPLNTNAQNSSSASPAISNESQSKSLSGSQGNTATAQVQQYVSQKYGFRFSYPANYLLSSGGESDGRMYAYLGRKEDTNESEAPYIAVSVYENPQGESLQAVRERRNYVAGASRGGAIEQKQIANQAAIVFYSGGLFEMQHVMFKSPDGKRVIHLETTLVGEDGQPDPMQKDAEVILASFGF